MPAEFTRTFSIVTKILNYTIRFGIKPLPSSRETTNHIKESRLSGYGKTMLRKQADSRRDKKHETGRNHDQKRQNE
jgi:hypothetical protein